MSNLERISLDKSKKHPLVTIREHLIRYTWVIQNVLDKDVLDIACGTGYGLTKNLNKPYLVGRVQI